MDFNANDYFNTTTADEVNREFERKKQLSEERKKNYVPVFFLKAGQSATLRFVNMTKMEDIPLSFWEHMVWDPFYENWDKSRGGYVNFTCVKNKSRGITCPLCEKGDSANWVAIFLVIHIDNIEKDKESNTEAVKPRLKIWKVSSKTLSSIDSLYKPEYDKVGNLVSEGKPLSSDNVFVKRTGTGSSTAYSFKFIANSKKPDDVEIIEQIKKVNLIEKFKPTEEKYNDMLRIASNWDEAKNRNKWQTRTTKSYNNYNETYQPLNQEKQPPNQEIDSTPTEKDIPF